MQHKIEKGVKLPDEFRRGRPLEFPWDKMKVGDSVAIGGKKAPVARRAAYSYGRRHGVTFTSRREKSGVRIWRLK